MAASHAPATTSTGDGHDRLQPPHGQRLRTPRAAGAAGLAFALLFFASIMLLHDQPAAGSTASEIREF